MTDATQNERQNLKRALEALKKAELSNIKLRRMVKHQANVIVRLAHIIQNQAATIQNLRANPPISSIQIWRMLEGILNHDESFHFPQPIAIKVQNMNDENRTITKKIIPKNVICICSIEKSHPEYDENERRKKLIFVREETAHAGVNFKCFLINNKKDKRVDFIFQTVTRIHDELPSLGSTLKVLYGTPADCFHQLVATHTISAVYTNHDYEPYATERDAAITHLPAQNNIPFYSF